MLQMSSMLRESGAMPGATAGAGLFGVPPTANPAANSAAGSTPSTNPPFNPSLWPPFPQPTQTAGTSTAPGAGGSASSAPPGGGTGLIDPALMQQIFGGLGAGTGGGGFTGLGGMGGLGAVPQQPTDSRTPEERFQVQLQVGQLILLDLIPSLSFHAHSNCKTWASSTRHKTSARCSRREATCTLRLNISCRVEGYN